VKFVKRVLTALWLVPVFLVALVHAGLDTVRVILWQRGSIEPGIAQYRFAGLSPTGAVVLAYLISLTPGTTSVELDYDATSLTVHLLDLRRRAESFADVETKFERPLRVLFPERRP